MTISTFMMRGALRQLAERHGCAPVQLPRLPLLDPVQVPATITGICSSPIIDAHRTLIAAGAITWGPDVPLMIDHGEATAGRITSLAYSMAGELVCQATIDAERAVRLPGLSVAVDVQQFELADADDPNSFHAVVTSATLREISVTAFPVNDRCTVKDRQYARHLAFHSLMIRKLQTLRQVAELLKPQGA